MEKKLLVAAAILIVLAGMLYFLFQPSETDDWYVEYEGDEYLKGEITEDSPNYEEPAPDEEIEFGTTLTVDECLGIDDLAGNNFVSKDYCLYMVGTGKNSDNACELIDDFEQRELCYTEIAYNTGDASYCEKVIRSRSECIVDVALRTNNFTLCDDASYEHDNCLRAIETDNNSFCKNTGRFMGFCFDAVDLDMPGECDKVYDWSKFCYGEIALETNNSSLCPNAESSDYCYYEIARDTGDVSLCEKVGEGRDSCVAWIAYETGNVALCEQAGKEKELCIEDILSR